MGIDGHIYKGHGVLVNWAFLAEEERKVFSSEFYCNEFPKDVGQAVDGCVGVQWLTILWSSPPKHLFDWYSEERRRPEIFTQNTMQRAITTENASREYYRGGNNPLVIRLRDSVSAFPDAHAVLLDHAPGIAAIVCERGPALIAGEWIVYRTS